MIWVLYISKTQTRPYLIWVLSISNPFTFREILWQQSLYFDQKIDEKQSVEPIPENVVAGDVDDVAIHGLRYMISVG